MHDDGGFDGSTCFVEEEEGRAPGQAGECGDDSRGAIAEFGVGGAEVDHEILVDAAGAHHERGGDGVERELGGGAGLHARRAGEDFGAALEDDEVVSTGRARHGGTTEQACDGRRFEGLAVGESADGVGGGAAGGDAEHCVVAGEVEGVELGLGAEGIVFFALAGDAERRVAAGDDADDTISVDLEGGRRFGGVEHAETAARACAEIDEAAALDEAALGGLDEGGDLGFGVGDGVEDGAVFLVDRAHAVGDGECVEVERARVALLGEDVGAIGRERGHAGW